MSTSAKQKVQQAELHKKLWSIANDLRGTMDASEFRNYILGLIFYRYLSEKTEQRVIKLLEEDNISYEEAWKDPEYQKGLKEELVEQIGYVIEPKDLYSAMVAEIERANKEILMWKCSRKPSAKLKNLLWDMPAKRISITCWMT